MSVISSVSQVSVKRKKTDLSFCSLRHTGTKWKFIKFVRKRANVGWKWKSAAIFVTESLLLFCCCCFSWWPHPSTPVFCYLSLTCSWYHWWSDSSQYQRVGKVCLSFQTSVLKYSRLKPLLTVEITRLSHWTKNHRYEVQQETQNHKTQTLHIHHHILLCAHNIQKRQSKWHKNTTEIKTPQQQHVRNGG